MHSRAGRTRAGALVAPLLWIAAMSHRPAALPAVPSDEGALRHAVERLTFGATTVELDRARRMGLQAWLSDQIDGQPRPNPLLDAKLTALTTIGLSSEQIGREYFQPAREERRKQQRAQTAVDETRAMAGTPMGQKRIASEVQRRDLQVLLELAEARILRAVHSERQLEEVLVDFWFNHFNVFAGKGQTRAYVTEYEREVIRPHVFGRFRDMLEASAKSPAMLFYLDAWLSRAPEGAPTLAADRVRAGMRGQRPRLVAHGAGEAGAAQASPPPSPGRARGLNENYARELLELHTLGVDGGYTQQDIVDVARALTGWTLISPRQRGRREARNRDLSQLTHFVPAFHDAGEKRVLGHTIRARGGESDAEQVFDVVAQHPSTARFLATKLARRLVSDEPPATLVDRAAARFRDTDGDLREVVRAIVFSPEFFAPETYGAKVKSPFEFVVSTLRVSGAEVGSTLPLVRALRDLGMPLYYCAPPTGYADTADAWVSSAGLVGRMNFALELAGGKLRGLRVPAGAQAGIETARATATQTLLLGRVSETTKATLERATTPAQVIALALGSPEFQRK